MISLLYCGNSAVFRGMLLSALSAAMHTAQPLDVHILTMDATDRDARFTPVSAAAAAFLEEQLRTEHPDSRVTLHDGGALFRRELAHGANADTAYTPYTLLRLLIDLVPGLPDPLLYLDTDTVVLQDLTPLYRFNTGDSHFAAAKDFLGKIFIGPHYMNAGVMLFRTAKIRESGILTRARALCNARRFAFPDQDVLNRCEQKKCFLPRRYNEQYCRRADTVIRHFSKTIRFRPFFHTVNVKPWDIDGIHRLYKTDFYDALFARFSAAMAAFEEAAVC